ncbi:MAG: hypothetical protein KDJ65_11495 [Anaerolineae bacterium]|nr:hypothetical protein [Anaerolineae bacterium]
MPGAFIGAIASLILGVLVVVAPQTVIAEAGYAIIAPADSAGITLPVSQASASTELWTLGFVVEGQPTYNDIIGRILDKAVFRSYRDSDIYYMFPAAGSLPTIKSARFKIVDKSGTYGGGVDLTLGIFDSESGDIQQIVATADDDWLSSKEGSWVSMLLEDAEAQVGPDEFLAFHFHLRGDAGGDLDVRPEFEVEVTQPTIEDLIEADIISADTIASLTGLSTVTSTQALSATVPQPSKEIWRAGFTVEGTARYEAAKGRLVDTVAAVRSDRSVSDIYYLFPATPTKLVTILSAKFSILEKTGLYDGDVKLSLEIYSADGGSPRLISTETIDVTEVETNKWISIGLSSIPAYVNLSTDDYLAVHFEFKNGSSGDFDVRPMFEVETAFIEVEGTDKLPNAPQIYVPIFAK